MRTSRELKHHPEYWNTHKEIWQQEYYDLTLEVKEMIEKDGECSQAVLLNKKVDDAITRKLLSIEE
jgi:hypothetical protein